MSLVIYWDTEEKIVLQDPMQTLQHYPKCPIWTIPQVDKTLRDFFSKLLHYSLKQSGEAKIKLVGLFDIAIKIYCLSQLKPD